MNKAEQIKQEDHKIISDALGNKAVLVGELIPVDTEPTASDLKCEWPSCGISGLRGRS